MKSEFLFVTTLGTLLLLYSPDTMGAPAKPALQRDLLLLQELPIQREVDSPEVQATLHRADTSITETLEELVSEGRPLAEIEGIAKGLMHCEEWPTNASSKMLPDLRHRREPVCILYRSNLTSRGEVIYCFANLLLVQSNRSRVSPQFHTLARTAKGHVTSSFLPNLPTDLSGLSSRTVFLGFINHGGPRPSILLLAGPHGSGEFLRLYLFVYAEEYQAWTSKKIFDSSPISSYAYDESKHELEYSIRRINPNSGRGELEKLTFAVPKNLSALKAEGPFDR